MMKVRGEGVGGQKERGVVVIDVMKVGRVVRRVDSQVK